MYVCGKGMEGKKIIQGGWRTSFYLFCGPALREDREDCCYGTFYRVIFSLLSRQIKHTEMKTYQEFKLCIQFFKNMNSVYLSHCPKHTRKNFQSLWSYCILLQCQKSVQNADITITPQRAKHGVWSYLGPHEYFLWGRMLAKTSLNPASSHSKTSPLVSFLCKTTSCLNKPQFKSQHLILFLVDITMTFQPTICWAHWRTTTAILSREGQKENIDSGTMGCDKV